MNVDCRWPGSVHGTKIINKRFHKDKIPINYWQILPARPRVDNDQFCDPSYPCTPDFMKECYSCLNNTEVIVNNKFRSSRNPILHDFLRLKAGWGFLTYTIHLKLENVTKVVFACFLSHYCCELN